MTDQPQPRRCCKVINIYAGLATYSYLCKRKAVVTADGKGWCTQHSPAKVAARKAAATAKWDARRAERARDEYNRLAGDWCRARGMTLESFGPDQEADIRMVTP